MSEKYKTEFLEKIKEVEGKIVNHETFGDTTEFYDEDGAILMTSTEDEEGFHITFGAENYDFDRDVLNDNIDIGDDD